MKKEINNSEFLVRHHWKDGEFSPENLQDALEQMLEDWLQTEAGNPESKRVADKNRSCIFDGTKSRVCKTLTG